MKNRHMKAILMRTICAVLIWWNVFGCFTVLAAKIPSLLVQSVSIAGNKSIVKIMLNHPEDIAGLQFSVRYDNSELSISETDIKKGSALTNWYSDSNIIANRGLIKLAYASSTGLKVTAPVEVCSISFTVLKNASGDADISIESIVAGNGKAESIPVTSKGTTVTVGGEQPDEKALEMAAELHEINAGLLGDGERSTVQNISNVVASVTNAISYSITTSNQASSKILDNAVKEMIDNIAAISTGFVNDENLISVNGFFTAVIDAVGSSLTENTNIDNLNRAAEMVRRAVNGTATLIENVAGADTSKKLAEDVIPLSAAVLLKTGKFGGSYNGIERETAEMAGKAVEKAGTLLVSAGNNGSEASATISKEAMNELLARVDEAAIIAASLQDLMNDNGMTKEIEKRVLIHIDGDSGVNELHMEMPGELYDAVAGKEVDRIRISSSLVTITAVPGFLADTAGSTVSFLVSRTDATSAQTKKFSVLAAGTDIYDFGVEIMDLNGKNKTVTSFEEGIVIEFPYTLRDGESADTVTALYLGGDGNTENMIGRYDEETGRVSFETNHLSEYAAVSIDVDISDVSEDHWSYIYVHALAAKGIVGVTGSNAFRPNDPITRAEFAKLLTTALGISQDDADITFTDVAASDWSYKYIASAAELGIVNGIGNGAFGPGLTIRREDAAAMLTRALKSVYSEKGVTNAQVTLSFSDKEEISSYAADAVATAVINGLMNGKPGNQFDPAGTITRAEAAAVIYRLYNFR